MKPDPPFLAPWRSSRVVGIVGIVVECAVCSSLIERSVCFNSNVNVVVVESRRRLLLSPRGYLLVVGPLPVVRQAEVRGGDVRVGIRRDG